MRRIEQEATRFTARDVRALHGVVCEACHVKTLSNRLPRNRVCRYPIARTARRNAD
jgi:hypothetical protein